VYRAFRLVERGGNVTEEEIDALQQQRGSLIQAAISLCVQELALLSDLLVFTLGFETELAEACDVPMCWSCRSGVCHTCECGLIDGELEYSRGLPNPRAEELALICCSTPKTGVDSDL
jgi:hypothetical protein